MRLDLSRFKRRRVAAVAVGAVAIAGVAILPVLPAFAAAGCNVTYAGAPWTESPGVGGYTANITLANPGDAWTSWTLKFTLPSGQSLTQGWSANWTASGTAITATNLDWNAAIATGGSTSIGFNGRWTGSYSSPTAFTVNGVACNGGTPPTTTTAPTSRPPTTVTTRPPTTPPTTPTSCGSSCPHVDNPYSGATFYVNPEWAQKAAGEPNGSKISGVSTAVWLDSISAIAGSSSRMGLSQHLDAALAQKGSGPIVIEIVIYDLPGRDCAALASNGELGETDLPKYESQYIDPIVSILNASKYAPLRISAIIEPDSLPNLVTNASGQATATQECTDMKNNGNYEAGVEYAISKLHNVVNNNVYNYIDAAHHGWLGWSSNFGPAATELSNVVKASVGGTANIDGFITNTANTSALVEPFFTATTSIGGQQLRNTSTWIDFNDYVDEMGFATAFRSQLISDGMPSTIGMLIDTSRNGWGNCVATTAAPCAADGPNRPTAASTSTDPNTFVNASRVDRRIHLGNWCNQSGAGVGERPKAAPASGIDAYVWIKPPGESDGSSVAITNTQGKGFDRMCDPTYGGNARNGNSMTGALPGAPLSGDWFSVQFQQLVADAYPPLS